MIQKNEQIRLALESLDVNTIQSVLTFLDVKWRVVDSGENRVPTSDEIKIVAEHCMLKAFESDDYLFKMGGFEAEVVEGIVGIKYILTQSNPLSKLLG
jgi:hypothetical protein